MSDYIKREDAYSACCYETLECYMARKDIKALPSADVAPVRHGRWMEATRDDPCYYVCSICGKMVDIEENYCPNCGAKMDEGGSNGTDD